MFIIPSVVDTVTSNNDSWDNNNINIPVNTDKVLFFKKNIFNQCGMPEYRILFIFSMDYHVNWLYRNESAMIEAFENIVRAVSTKTI